MVMTFDFIKKPATPARVQQLLSDIDRDLIKLERIEATYGTAGNDYRGTVDRIRNSFSLAEGLWAEIEQREQSEPDDGEMKSPVMLNGVGMAVKSQDPDFIKWANEQMRLAEMRNWE